MNVAILCGGYGTRLAGLWDGPKCLVPLGDGGPIIAHLIRRARVEALAKCTYVLVGHKGEQVIDELRRLSLLSPRLVIENEGVPRGTGAALRRANTIQPPVLVLNGDTLPLYDLGDLVAAWRVSNADILTTWCAGKAAGAMLLGFVAWRNFLADDEADLERWIARSTFHSEARIMVKGFLDIGTPHGYALGRRWRTIA